MTGGQPSSRYTERLRTSHWPTLGYCGCSRNIAKTKSYHSEKHKSNVGKGILEPVGFQNSANDPMCAYVCVHVHVCVRACVCVHVCLKQKRKIM